MNEKRMIGIGIDTGGTYTDAVAFDMESRRVLARGKARTTKENLTVGIDNAIATLPADIAAKADTVALSTTLATNACVENKGGRAKLILMGTTRKVLEWIGADKKYGLRGDDILCLDTHGSFDGSVVDEPDWDKVTSENAEWFAEAQAFALTEIYSFKNGAIVEKNAKKYLSEKYGVPVVCSSELVSGLDMMERGVTAYLNARLLPVIDEFIESASKALSTRGINAPAMIVRSDGTLMSEDAARAKPVETIMSGPAASILGASALTEKPDCIIVDMGGTTTDISLIRDGKPVSVEDGIRIGGWRTQVKGVFMDTFALGGDTEVLLSEEGPFTGTRRVIPVCVTSSKYPEIKDDLRRLLDGTPTRYNLPQFCCFVRDPSDKVRLSEDEKHLVEMIRQNPVLISEIPERTGVDLYKFDLEKLEDNGVIIRSALTPTDVMHINGDFSTYDAEASSLAAECFRRANRRYDCADSENVFCEDVYLAVKKKLYENILRILLTYKYPAFGGEIGDCLERIIESNWLSRDKKDGFFNVSFLSNACLVGVGAPTHVFLPEVAEYLGVECLIPDGAEVANAVGAVCANVSATVKVEIKPVADAFGSSGYYVHTPDGVLHFDMIEEAKEAALEAAKKAAIQEAELRGAKNISVTARISSDVASDSEGTVIELGSYAYAEAVGH